MSSGSGGLGQLGQEQGRRCDPLLTAPAIGHQLIEPTIRPPGAELGEHVAEIGVGLEAMELRRRDDGVEDRGPLGAGVGAGEQPVVATDGDATQCALDRAVVELELPVEEEDAERSALALEVRDRLAERAFGLVAAVVLGEPRVELVQQRRRKFAAPGQPRVGVLAGLLRGALDPVEALDDVDRDRCVSPRSAGTGDLAAPGEATSRPRRSTTFPARSTSRAFVSSSCTSAAAAATCCIVPWSAATSAAPTRTGATDESDGSNPTCVDPRMLPPSNVSIA